MFANCEDEVGGGRFITVPGDDKFYCELGFYVFAPLTVQGCEIEEGVDFFGSDLVGLDRVTSSTHCAIICASTPDCRSWTFNTDPSSPTFHRCFLKHAERSNVIDSPGRSSGLPCLKYRGTGEPATLTLSASLSTGQTFTLTPDVDAEVGLDVLEAILAIPDQVGLTISFTNGGRANPEDILAVYTSSEISGRQVEGEPLLWVYTCGTQTCTEPRISGSVTFTANNIPPGSLSFPFPVGVYRVVLISDTAETREIVAVSPELTIRATPVVPENGVVLEDPLTALSNSLEQLQSLGFVTGVSGNSGDLSDLDANFATLLQGPSTATPGLVDAGVAALSALTVDNTPVSIFGRRRQEGDLGIRCGSFQACVQYYDNIGGGQRVEDLFNAAKFPLSPDSESALTSLNLPNRQADNFGAQVEAWFRPRQTGTFKFVVDSDDGSRVRLSTVPNIIPPTDSDMLQVATQGCCSKVNHEVSVQLTAGISYFLRAYLKDALGGNRLLIGVQNPDGTETFPLEAQDLGYTGALRCGDSTTACATFYYNIPGDKVTDLFAAPNFPNSPDFSESLTSFAFTERGTIYGAVVEAWFRPPQTDSYRFVVDNDDEAQVLLFTSPGLYPQTDLDMINVVQNDCCGRRESVDTYHLIAGNSYFLRAYLKEHYGGDRLSVGVIAQSTNTEIFPLTTEHFGYISTREITVQVGPSGGSTTTVDVYPGLNCPTAIRTAADETATWTVVNNGNSLTITRTDSPNGWTLDLSFQCNLPLTYTGDFATCGGSAAAAKQEGIPCQFPFEHEGVLYDHCINDFIPGSGGEPWCRTGVPDPSDPSVDLWGSCACAARTDPVINTLSYATAPRAGLPCAGIGGFQEITSLQQCRQACTALGSSFEVISRDVNPGCSRRVTGANVGVCQWNTNVNVYLYDLDMRHLCHDLGRSTAARGVNRSNRKVIPAPRERTCAEQGAVLITNQRDCQVACELLGERDNFRTGVFDRPAGCWIEPGNSCSWNSRRNGGTNAGVLQEVCIRPRRHYPDQCLKSGNTNDCCGTISEVTCTFGYALQAPLSGTTCDPNICGQRYCIDNPTAGAYRCVAPDEGWQPAEVGQASCGPTRIYHGGIGLSACVERCELDPLCNSIFGALSEGDNSCWTCPESRPRPATQLGDGELIEPNLATVYKMHQLIRRTKYEVASVRGGASCPEGFHELTLAECRAMAAAIITSGTLQVNIDNNAAPGCRIPVSPTDANSAAPTFSTGNGPVDEDTKLICRVEIPTDALVSLAGHVDPALSSFTMATVSGDVSDSGSGIRLPEHCLDGMMTTFCSSARGGDVTSPHLEFHLKEPYIMVMRVWVAARGDDRVRDLGRFTVEVHDGIAWQLCAFRVEVDFVQQYTEVLCDYTIYGTAIRISLGDGNENILEIADVIVQGIPPEDSMPAVQQYRRIQRHQACDRSAVLAHREYCQLPSETDTECIADAQKACNGKIQCHGFDYNYLTGGYTLYHQRAALEHECSGTEGLASTDGRTNDFFVRERNDIDDVICFERPCWSYNFSQGLAGFKTDGCTEAQQAIAEATVREMETTRRCNSFDTVAERTACFDEIQFRLYVGEVRYAVFERQRDITDQTCPFVRRMEEEVTTEEDNVNEALDTRRRLQQATEGSTQSAQCRAKAQLTNTVACDSVREAATKTMELAQDQFALAERRRNLLERNRKVAVATGVLDFVAGTGGLLSADKPKAKFGGAAPRNAAAGINLIGGIGNVIGDDRNARNEIDIADEELRLMRREADEQNYRDASDIAATCDARSTDDLLCDITDLRESVDDQFYQLIRVAEGRHREVMDQLARQEEVLESNLFTAESISNAIDRTNEILQQTNDILQNFAATIEDIEFLRVRYLTFSDPNPQAFAGFAQSGADWCEFVQRTSDVDLFERLVAWTESEAFRSLHDPAPERQDTMEESGKYTPCEITEYRREYTEAHRSIEVLYNFANGIRNYAVNFRPNVNTRNRVTNQRSRMAAAYNRTRTFIDGLNTDGVIRCVGQSFDCPARFHRTHVIPDPQAREVDTARPEPVTRLPCAPNTCTCQNGNPDSQPCDGINDARCISCFSGYRLTSDATCVLIVATCPNGTPKTTDLQLEDEGQVDCARCDPGYHDERGFTPERGNFLTCEENVCYCDNTRGIPKRGLDCNEHYTGDNPGTPGFAELYSQCESCLTESRTLVQWTSSRGRVTTCEVNDGVRLYRRRNFNGDVTTLPRGQAQLEFWMKYEQTGSIVVLPGFCVGLREATHHYHTDKYINNHFGRVTQDNRYHQLGIEGEQYLCNCHSDQTSTNEAYGFDRVNLKFAGIRRFLCSDPYLSFMRPFDTPGALWHYHKEDINNVPIREGPVDVDAGVTTPTIRRARGTQQHQHTAPGYPWFRGQDRRSGNRIPLDA